MYKFLILLLLVSCGPDNYKYNKGDLIKTKLGSKALIVDRCTSFSDGIQYNIRIGDYSKTYTNHWWNGVQEHQNLIWIKEFEIEELLK